jgi:ubiquitin-like domain-containing CTD phosphatase 1
MFTVVSTKRDGTSVKHHVKPLQIIWSKFPDRWGSHNTVHIDDLSRNFALNLENGLQCTAYYRKKKSGKRDTELLGLGNYLIQLSMSGMNFNTVDLSQWADVVSGKKSIADSKKENGKG